MFHFYNNTCLNSLNISSLFSSGIIISSIVFVSQFYRRVVVLVQCNSNLCKILLNVEASNLMFLKTHNIEFDEIIITFKDQNGRPLEIEDKVNLTSLINK